MTELHECGCSTFGPDPHDPDLRHPRPRSCHHDADPEPEKEDAIVLDVPYVTWRDENGTWFFTVPHG